MNYNAQNNSGVVETPDANPVAGMCRFLTTYSARFNLRQELDELGGRTQSWLDEPRMTRVNLESPNGCGRKWQ